MMPMLVLFIAFYCIYPGSLKTGRLRLRWGSRSDQLAFLSELLPPAN